MFYSTISILVGIAAFVDASCMHATSKLQRRVTPEGGVEVSTFGYTDLIGPLNWAALDAENSACTTGTVQSPINIDETIPITSEAPIINFPSVESAEFENLGSTVEVIVNGTTQFAGVDFELKQFHFHTPSEHRIHEEYYPLEMHMVHEAADGSGAVAVLAIVFDLSTDGSTTDLLTRVTEHLDEIATPGTVTETAALDFEELAHHLTTTPLFQYTGSLTTPPCAEGITFLLTEEPLPIDVATYNALKSVIKFNSRFTQNKLGNGNLLLLENNLQLGIETNAIHPSLAEAHEDPVMDAALALMSAIAAVH
ncbi:alpha carbonic anhydrase [Lineolata rhizophorae]|uniref:Carbonic anhydrase n=1 Tax=Lineolata rhizophorae TaxID=578093 RepID=A0A6A6NQQ7_9PEZI|nr:alpha carbonic anhydrase [Lineolata rhizophorae]